MSNTITFYKFGTAGETYAVSSDGKRLIASLGDEQWTVAEFKTPRDGKRFRAFLAAAAENYVAAAVERRVRSRWSFG
jgi:hypothetical protein